MELKIGIVIGEFDPITKGQIDSIQRRINERALTAAWIVALPFGHASLNNREKIIDLSLKNYPHISVMKNTEGLDDISEILKFVRNHVRVQCELIMINEGSLAEVNGEYPEIARLNLRNNSGVDIVPLALDYINENNLYGYTGKEKSENGDKKI